MEWKVCDFHENMKKQVQDSYSIPQKSKFCICPYHKIHGVPIKVCKLFRFKAKNDFSAVLRHPVWRSQTLINFDIYYQRKDNLRYNLDSKCKMTFKLKNIYFYQFYETSNILALSTRNLNKTNIYFDRRH